MTDTAKRQNKFARHCHAGEAGAGRQLCVVRLSRRYGAQLARICAGLEHGASQAGQAPAWLPRVHCIQSQRRPCFRGFPFHTVAGLECLAQASVWPSQVLHQQADAPAAWVEPQAAPAPSPQPGAGAAPLTTAKLLSKLSKAEAQKGMLPAPDSALNFRPSVRLHGYLTWRFSSTVAPVISQHMALLTHSDNRALRSPAICWSGSPCLT